MKIPGYTGRILTACILFAGAALFAQSEKKNTPLIDYSTIKVKDGAWIDATGNATVTPGKTAVLGDGPFGGQAFDFDGSRGSISDIVFDKKIQGKLDGFDFSYSFWVKFDSIAGKDPLRSGNNTGLGFSQSEDNGYFSLNSVGRDVGISFSCAMQPNRWNHVAVSFSHDKKIARLYLNGFPVIDTNGSGTFFPIPIRFSKIGSFDGQIADFKFWDHAVEPDEFLNVTMDDKLYQNFSARIAELRQAAPGGRIMFDILQKKLDDAKAKKSMKVIDYDAFAKQLSAAGRMLPAMNAMEKTGLKNSPLAVMQVQAISPIIRLPDTFPSDAVYSDTLTATASRNEYESLSFIVYAYKDIEKFELELSELTNGSNVIPLDETQLRLVKCWFQPPWNSYFNGHGNYVPGLLLNDHALVKVDERKKINYVRFNYPDGVKYADVTIPGSVLKEPEFKFAFEPAYDADTLLPLPLEMGRGQQFWLTLHAKKGLPAGKYTGSLKMKADGQDAGTLKVEFTVLPLTLDIPRTQYDLSKEYFTELTGSASLSAQLEFFKDEDKAMERLIMHIDNQRMNGIRGQTPGFNKLTDEPLFVKDLRERLKRNLRPQYIFMGMADEGGLFRNASEAQIPFHEYATEKVVADSMEYFKTRVDKALEINMKEMGDTKSCFFYGIDEAQGVAQFRFMSYYRDYIFRNGGRVITTGWGDNYRKMPSFEDMHCEAAKVDRFEARRWHAINGRLTCYAGPFIGPDNPDLMRRSHGMKMYRSNYDGWYELQYDGGSGYHTWNHRFGYDTTYRPFRFIVATQKGPVINTLAIHGMREGMDDVRYATLMYQLADECFASGNMDAVIAARKAISWFKNLPYPGPENLDQMRKNMVGHLLVMSEKLGKEMK